MRFLITAIIFLVLGSCNLTEAVDNLENLRKDLSKTFDHENIDIRIGLGTKKDDDKISVVFLEYDMDTKKYEELEGIAARVKNRILEKNPKFKKLELIEVSFTKEKDAENLDNLTMFKFRN